MRYGKLFIGFLTAVFLAVAVFFGTREYAWDGTVGLTAEITSGGKTETIRCWESEWGDYFVFLPGNVELSQVRLRTNTRRTVHLDDRLVPDGMRCEGLELDERYDLSFNMNRHYNVTFLQSGKIPAVYIDTVSGSMEHIHEVKGNEEAGTIRVYTSEGDLDYSGNLESMKGRGNATWLREKKPYSLTLYTQGDLLDMGQGENWILLANVYDDSNLRNMLAFDLAEAAGLPYSPSIRWTDLYLNGEYHGLYMLCERNEVHPQRVNIPRKGSFLVSMELQYRLEEQGYPCVLTESGTAFRVHYADMDEATLQQMLQSAENAILAEDGVDPRTGKHWQELIDLDSWAKKYLLEEVLGNYDAGSVSQYLYFDGSDPSGKIYAGPAWDYDNILGNQSWQILNPQALLAGRPHISGNSDSPWYYALYQKEEFRQQVKEQYRRVFRPLLTELLEGGIADYAQTTLMASIPNRWRWNMEDQTAGVERIQTYLAERVAFLDSLWIDEAQYLTVQISNGFGCWTCFALRPGECLTYLPEYDPEAYLGWYTQDTEEPFDVTQPLFADTVLYLKPAPKA